MNSKTRKDFNVARKHIEIMLIEFVCKTSMYEVFIRDALIIEKAQETYSEYTVIRCSLQKSKKTSSSVKSGFFCLENETLPSLAEFTAKVEMQMKKCGKSYPLSELFHPITRRGIDSIPISLASNISRR